MLTQVPWRMDVLKNFQRAIENAHGGAFFGYGW